MERKLLLSSIFFFFFVIFFFFVKKKKKKKNSRIQTSFKLVLLQAVVFNSFICQLCTPSVTLCPLTVIYSSRRSALLTLYEL